MHGNTFVWGVCRVYVGLYSDCTGLYRVTWVMTNNSNYSKFQKYIIVIGQGCPLAAAATMGFLCQAQLPVQDVNLAI